MNYIELINRFWQLDAVLALNPADKLLYFALLNLFNRSGWSQTLTLPNTRLMAATGFSANTLRKSRGALIAVGLIEVQPGCARASAAVYRLIDTACQQCTSAETSAEIESKTESKFESKSESKTESKTESKSESKTESKSESKTALKTESKTAPYIKPKTETETNILTLQARVAKKRAQAAAEVVAPSLDEMNDCFRTIGASGKVDNWQHEARRFYNYYQALGWKSRHGQPIYDWRAQAENWLLSGNSFTTAQRSPAPRKSVGT